MSTFAYIASGITWRPGFHDNDFAGWLVTAGYVVVVTACFLAAQRTRKKPDATPKLARTWTTLGLLLFLLGVNQQLDLQTLMIEAGRALSSGQGWYEYRRLVQKVFFGVFALVMTTFGIVFAYRWREFLNKNRWVTAGLAILLWFILMRAASIDHVGESSLKAVKEASWKDCFELSGLVLIVVGVVAESREQRRSEIRSQRSEVGGQGAEDRQSKEQ